MVDHDARGNRDENSALVQESQLVDHATVGALQGDQRSSVERGAGHLLP